MGFQETDTLVVGSPVGKIAAHRGNGMQLFLLHSCPSSDLIVDVLGYADAMALFFLYSNGTQGSCIESLFSLKNYFSWIIYGCL